jgi:glutathione peroxidase
MGAQVVLIVNVASKCGFTPQYKGLEELYLKYKDQGLEILGFPCNQFGSQEPGSNDGTAHPRCSRAEIVSFCSLTYGVSFPVLDKIDVNGDKAHPLYEWLKNEKKQLMMARIKWNFEVALSLVLGWLIEEILGG